MKRLVSWGAGELGGRVIERWRAEGGEVLAFTHTERRHDALKALGAEPHLGSPADHLRSDDVLLVSLPGSPAQRAAVESLAEVEAPSRVVMVSTTGYYGGPQGPVTPETPPGSTERAQTAAAAEAALRHWVGARGVAVRFGGLYRAGKGPQGPLARRGHPPVGPEGKTLALIHYDDAATVLFNALQHASPAPVYVAVTPPCPTRGEYYRLACERLGLDAPEFNGEVWRPAEYDVSALLRDVLPEPAWPDWRAATE
ncbi:MAG: hypothetical protein ACE366_31470 [Bradymonadia bacterium]